MKNKFRVSIRTFIGLSSLALLLVFIFILYDALQNIRDISAKASSVRLTSLPDIIESQRSFINIESLRRLAEVAYVSEDPRKRREARINAQALAAESVFGDKTGFHAEARKMARLIAELVTRRDAAHNNRLRLQELSREYLRNIMDIASFLKNDPAAREIIQAYYDSSLPSLDQSGVSQLSSAGIRKLQKTDAELMERIQERCAGLVARHRELAPYCDRLAGIYPEYSAMLDLLDENLVSARAQWSIVDDALREMRDNVSSDSEFVTTDALSSIEQQAHASVVIVFAMLLGGTLFILAFIFAQNWLIARPVRWIGQKLLSLQKGQKGQQDNLHAAVPNIRITELYQVADLLDRFSEHLAELTSRASLLAEDAAEKKDLEALMSAIFQLSVDGYAIWTPAGLISANQEMLRLFGLKSTDEMRDKWSDLGFLSGEELESFYRTVLKNGFERRETYLRNVSGELIPFEISFLPMQRQGKDCVFSYFRDLSEQKRTENILREARDEAEKAAQVKSEFLARMSHEIRTPMNGVIGLTNLALAAGPPPAQREYLEKIQSSARILLGVINDILDFSKLESGRFVLEDRPFSFDRLLGTVRDLFEAQAEAKGLEFKIEADPDIPPYLKGDELRLSQVLLNLCGNALKFTEKGGVTLRVALTGDTPGTVGLKFAIIDSGVGMSEAQVGGLFQPFTQADTSTTRKYGGTGLGLVISKLLVEMMQGSIKVVSVPGLGSTFSFDVVLEKAPDGLEEEETAAHNEQDDELLKGKRALLAEDNEINQEIAVAMLETLGLETTVAGNGREAIERLAGGPFDVVLMDIQMPVLDGLSAAKEIRDRGNDIPIIAMTAHAMQEDRAKSLGAGMNGHITKPIDQQELREALCKVLR